MLDEESSVLIGRDTARISQVGVGRRAAVLCAKERLVLVLHEIHRRDLLSGDASKAHQAMLLWVGAKPLLVLLLLRH